MDLLFWLALVATKTLVFCVVLSALLFLLHRAMLHQPQDRYGDGVKQKQHGENAQLENDAFATISASRYSKSSQSIQSLDSQRPLSSPHSTHDTNTDTNEKPQASGSLLQRTSLSSHSTRMMKSEFLELRRRSATFRKIIEKENQENQQHSHLPSWAGSTPPLSAMLGRGKLALRGGVGGVLQESKGVPRRPALTSIDWNMKTPGNSNVKTNANAHEADSPLSMTSDTHHDSNNDRDRDGSSSPESAASGMRSHTSTELTEPSPRSLLSSSSKHNPSILIQPHSPSSSSMEEEDMMMMTTELDENMLVYCSSSEFLPTMVSTPPPPAVAQRVSGKGGRMMMMEVAGTPLSVATAAKMARNRLGSGPFVGEAGGGGLGGPGVQRLARFEGGKLSVDEPVERYQVHFGMGGGISPGIGGGKFDWEGEEEGDGMKSVVVEV